ncbi:MAG: sugar phosphate isomerase/epimerase [Acidobacteriia bacterium]|nr:sugar phosphate isomerase/epimerase [Terriglobia bacterium]MBV8904539.1 sugar phosphate isomerase/epimerase [Terriglobia bacterium]MBV9745129.1 sugar phosphate isomerase/epimerase [Terriglobia bacterium]
MDHVLSTHLFVNHRLTTAMLNRIQQAGIMAVEIFCARQHLDYRNKAQIAELGHWFRDSEMKLHSLHSPMYTDEIWGRSGPHAVITITETVKGQRLKMVDEIKRALEIAEVIPMKYLIQHIGVGGEEYDPRKFEAAFSALEELSLFAHQRGVQILLENIPNELSSAERLRLFEEFTHLHLNYVFDTGHANIGEGIPAAFDLMKEKIRSTHIHDNDGKSDSHLFPFLSAGGTIDWNQTMQLLRSRPDRYPLLLELKENPQFPNPLESVLQIFEKLEAAGVDAAMEAEL